MRSDKAILCELLSIGLVKAAEESSPNGPASVDLDAKLDKNGRIANPVRFLADRAALLLPSVVGFSPRAVKWGVTAVFRFPTLLILLLAAAVYPLGRVESILGTGLVNLAGPYLIFLAAQIFFLALALISLSVTIIYFLFSRFWRRDKARLSETARRLGVFGGMFGALLLSVIRGVVGFWAERVQKRTDSAKSEKIVDSVGSLGRQTLSHQRTLLFYGGFLSHLFWFTLSTVALLILLTRMQGNRYDYCWDSSLGDMRQAETVIRFLGRPVGLLAPVPGEREIRWLFENSAAETVVSKVPGETTVSKTPLDPIESARIRRDWSWFLLAVVLVWGVIPRLILTGVYRALFVFSLRDFRPDLTDPYYVRVLERHEDRTGRTLYESVCDKQPDTLGPLAAPNRPQTPAEPVSTAFKGSETLLVGVDTSMNRTLGRAIFGSSVKNAGDILASREEKKAFFASIGDCAQNVGRLVALIDVGFPPARQTRLFLQNELFAPLERAELFVILSCGERLRKKFRSDPEAVRMRCDDWRDIFRQMADLLRRPITVIDFYDHELDVAESRQKLAAIFGQNATSVSENHFIVAKRITLGAVETIQAERDAFERLDTNDAAERVSEIIRTGYNALLELYQNRGQTFFASLAVNKNKVREHFDTLSSHAASLTGAATEKLREKNLEPEKFFEQLSVVSAAAIKAKSLASKLSPKCAICFGAVGASIPVFALAAPVLGGTASAAALLSAASSLLPASVFGGLSGAALGAFVPSSLAALKNKITRFSPFGSTVSETEPSAQNARGYESGQTAAAFETVAISLTTWSLIFELSPRSSEQIAALLPKLLEPLETTALDSVDSVRTALERTEALLNAVERSNEFSSASGAEMTDSNERKAQA